MPLHVFGTKDDVGPFFLSGAVGIRRPKAIRFKHGVLSPGAYIDNRVLPSHPDSWSIVIHQLIEHAQDLGKQWDVIASVATGGTPHGAALAHMLGAPHFTIKKEEKGHGVGGLIDGDLKKLRDMRVLLVEDMSSTFMSSLKAMKPIEAAGAEVTNTITLNTWGLPDFHTNIGKHHVHALVTGEMIVDCAKELGDLDEEHEKVVRHWLKHPEDEEWSKDGSWELPKDASE